MLLEYVQIAMAKARYEILPDDGSYYGHIPGFCCVVTPISRLFASSRGKGNLS